MKIAQLAHGLIRIEGVEDFFAPEHFIERVYERSFDVAILSFDYYEQLKDIRDYFYGTIFFIDRYYDLFRLRRSLQIGDYYFLESEYERILEQLHYLRKKLYGERILRFGDLFFDRQSGRCYKGAKEFHLTPAERELLQLLAQNRPVGFEEIFERTKISNKESLKVVVARLRKLGFRIESVKNFGYQLHRKERM